MYKTRLGDDDGIGGKAKFGYIEMDPSGRYGRFREILGKGAMKTVYKAFDEALGMEVAWSQVKLNDVFRSPDELQRLYAEVHLLKDFDHESIIKCFKSWVDIDRRTFNFITEMFTSGTLREYRQKYQRVDIRAVKNWARQILRGLAYLHSHDPPVIHRDLKCDNIFVNGHLGQVKIGDFGLAAILREAQHAHSVIGTPEFMAPELYEEDYDELVDIYSFGMCVLEMLTSEYPYSECSNPAQIYKKVTSGKLPAAYYKIQDVEAQKFVGKCLENALKRLPARELLLDPFLASDEGEFLTSPRTPNQKTTTNGTVMMIPPSLSSPKKRTNMTITGTMNQDDDDAIFLKVTIKEEDGHARNIYFPFDIVNDTAIDVAMEMVKELEINDLEPFDIAEMIEEEVSALVPTWKNWGSPKNYEQHSFDYKEEEAEEEEAEEEEEEEEDDYNGFHHPFHSLSSHSSSQASPCGSSKSCRHTQFCRGNDMTTAHDWLQEDSLVPNDTSSQSSLNSGEYSNWTYCSGNENDSQTSPRKMEPVSCLAISHGGSRFCPGDRTGTNGYKRCSESKNTQKKMTKMRSLVDVRSQLLHRSLVEEVNKRRMFKTVGAVENIGFQQPKCDTFPPERHFNGELFDSFRKFQSP